MANKRRVAVCGNSLSVASIAATPQDKPGLELLALDPSLPCALQRLDRLAPGVIICDLATAHAVEGAVSLLSAHSNLMLVGFDLTSHRALLLCGEQSTVLTTDDLIQIVERR